MHRGERLFREKLISRAQALDMIRTGLEVDLTGQVCSESIGYQQFSGTGGQADTVMGAQMSPGGKPFIALYSTAEVKQPDGSRRTMSKIAPRPRPQPVFGAAHHQLRRVGSG